MVGMNMESFRPVGSSSFVALHMRTDHCRLGGDNGLLTTSRMCIEKTTLAQQAKLSYLENKQQTHKQKTQMKTRSRLEEPGPMA